MLTAIKNSGIFFAAAILIYALAVIPKNTKNILRWTACAACCAGTLKVWQMHVKLYFADGMTGKHSMSIANFKQVLGGKTDEELKIIVSAFADEVFSLSNNVIFILLVSAVIFSVYRFCRSSALKPAVHDCIFALISYILYQLGNLGMYIFTMPAEEAVCLACYDRYHDSILIFICAVMTIAVLQLAENISALPEQRLISCLMYLMCAAAVYVALKPDLSFFTRRNLPQNSDRVALMQIMEDYDIPLGSKCVIILDDDYGLQMSYRHMARYTLDSEDVKVRYLSDLKQQENLLNTHRYVIAFHQSDEISEYMREKFGENAPRAVDLTEQQL